MKFVLAKIGVYTPKLAHIKGNTFVKGGSDFWTFYRFKISLKEKILS